MAEIWFYHLEQRPLDQVLPILLERSLGRGWRVVVQAGGPERVMSLDALLWTYAEDSFLPHGTASDGAPETQPVYITDGPDNPNGAALRICLDGVAVPSATEAQGSAVYERILVLFDGRDDAAVEAARSQWAALKTEGHRLSYWQQADHGRWEKRA